MRIRSAPSLALALVAAVLWLGVSRAEAANFAGTWSINGTLGDPVVATIAPVCTLKQDGDELHGTCKGPNGFGTATGAVDGDKILLTWKHAATHEPGFDGIATLKGTLDDEGVIRGTWSDSAVPDAWGRWTGQKITH